MTNYLLAMFGGALIGTAAILLLWACGRVAGISGMIGGIFGEPGASSAWRYAFLGGLVTGGWLMHLMGYTVFRPLPEISWAQLVAAGLLVGFGTQLGSGCTSGHGVCGIGRFSLRSVAATLTFMAAGAATVYLIRHVWGGS